MSEDKQRRLDQIKMDLLAEAEQDEEGWQIDTLILETLVLLNALGFYTWSSCQGHLPGETEDDLPNAGPYIEIAASGLKNIDENALEERARRAYHDQFTEEDMAFEKNQAAQIRDEHRRMIELLTDFYSKHTPTDYGVQLSAARPNLGYNGFTLASNGVWIEYSPEDQARFLKESQKELLTFTDFLRHRYDQS